MKIGVFDSGLGGLVIVHSLIKHLPQYSYIYLGDTARVPYGNRSQVEIATYTEECIRYLLDSGCQLVIVACNTASSDALRNIQQQLLAREYPSAKVLGVLIPAAEAAVEVTKNKKIGVLATTHTVKSQSFIREITKLMPEAQVYQEAAPRLVPLLEDSYDDTVFDVTEDYLRPVLSKDIDTLILGCTHYSLLTSYIRYICGEAINVISQDEILPQKLKNYLNRHPEIHFGLISDQSRQFLVTMGTPNAWNLSYQLFEGAIELREVSISNRGRFR